MKLNLISSFALAAAVASFEAGIQAAETKSVTLQDCLQMALEKNLDIRIQKLGPEISRAALWGAYGAYEPVFGAGVSYDSNTQPGGYDAQNRPYGTAQTSTERFNLGVNGLLPTGLTYNLGGSFNDSFGSRQDVLGGSLPFENTSGGFSLSFTQPLLRNFWIDGSRLNIALSRKNLEVSQLALRSQIINTVTTVELAYYELIAARETIGAAQIGLQLAEQLLRENRKRVEVGVLAPLDEKESESQVAASRATLLGAQNAYETQQNQIKSLLDDQFAVWQNIDLSPAEPLGAEAETFSLQDSWSKGIALRPDLQQAKIDLEQRNITLKYQKNQLFPQLDLVGSYGQSGSGKEFSDSMYVTRQGAYPGYSFGAVLSIPLGGNRQARSNVRASKAQIEQSLLRLKKMEQDVMVQISDAIVQARTSYEQVKATKEAVDFAVDALNAEQKKLENGKSTSFQVLQLQRTLTTRRYENIRARADYNSALARLAQAEGSTLERHHVNLEIR